nr:hypothetical protein CFP56_62488 [Quercus suber]
MSLDERSPKRQRLNSYSPVPSPDRKASPTEQSQQTLGFPETPPPSVHMSPSWTVQSLPTPVTHEQHQVANGLSSFPTPPNTAGFAGHNAGMDRNVESESEVASVQETPSTDVVESFQKGDEDAEMHDREEGEVEFAQHRRTDHERNSGVVNVNLFKLIAERKSRLNIRELV